MWPFPTRAARTITATPQPTGLPQFEDFERSDSEVKVWLPQTLVDRINWVSKQEDASRPDVMRGLLFQHLYGHVAYREFFEYKKQKHALAQRSARQDEHRIDQMLVGGQGGDILRSRRRSTDIDLAIIGKANADITWTLPAKMKQDLQEVAALHRLTPSSYIRKMLVLLLLGEQAHARWQHAVGQISPDVERIEAEG